MKVIETINSIYFRRLIFPFTTLASSFIGLIVLLKASELSGATDNSPILVILISRVGMGFILCWGAFFVKEAKSTNIDRLFLNLPGLSLALIIAIYNISLSLSFLFGSIQAIWNNSLLIKKKGTYTIFWGIFVNTIALIVLSFPSKFISLNWTFIYPFLFLFAFIFYISILHFCKIDKIDYLTIKNLKSYFQIFNKLKINKPYNIKKLLQAKKDILSRSFLAFMISIIYSLTPILVPVFCPTNLIQQYVFFDKITFSFCSALNSRFMVKGFLESKNPNINFSRIISFGLITSLFVFLVLLGITYLPIFPFNLDSFQNVINFSLEDLKKIPLLDFASLIIIIFLLSIGNSISVNSGIPLRFLQFKSQERLIKFSFNRNAFIKYMTIFISFTFSLFALYSLSKFIIDKNDFSYFLELFYYLIKPSIFFVFWWFVISIWLQSCAKLILKKNFQN